LALDHYVSQVHLRQFYAPALGGLIYATKKSDLKSFCCDSKSVCRIEENSTNAYLANDREVEDFLIGVEPKYNASAAKLRDGKIDQECIAVIGGFAAYVSCCAPAAMRIHTAPLENVVVSEAAILDRQGSLPRAPAALGNKTLTELLANRNARVDVDRKYPQAIGVSTIRSRTALWGNSRWEILRNNDPNNPFFTSDYPVALEARDARLANWLIPLAPDLAIRIIPDVGLSGREPEPSFAKFSCQHRDPRRFELLEINRLIVRSAEDMVFYSNNLPWIPKFIAKNRHYRIEAVTEGIPLGTGFLNIATQRIVAHRQP
jgi:hypothetical protein